MSDQREDRTTWPKYLRIESGSYGPRRDEDYTVLKVQLDYDWIALYFLVGHGERLSVSEVRVMPVPRNGIEQKRVRDATRSPARVRVIAGPANPHTGIGVVDGDDAPPRLAATTLRELKAEEALKVALSGLSRLQRGRSAIDARSLSAGVRQARRKAIAPTYEVVVVAAHYADVVRVDGRGNADVAARLDGYDTARVRRAISRARSGEFLTTSGKQGRQGGRLTAKARDVLADGPPPGYDGPLPPR